MELLQSPESVSGSYTCSPEKQNCRNFTGRHCGHQERRVTDVRERLPLSRPPNSWSEGVQGLSPEMVDQACAGGANKGLEDDPPASSAVLESVRPSLSVWSQAFHCSRSKGRTSKVGLQRRLRGLLEREKECSRRATTQYQLRQNSQSHHSAALRRRQCLHSRHILSKRSEIQVKNDHQVVEGQWLFSQVCPPRLCPCFAAHSGFKAKDEPVGLGSPRCLRSLMTTPTCSCSVTGRPRSYSWVHQLTPSVDWRHYGHAFSETSTTRIKSDISDFPPNGYITISDSDSEESAPSSPAAHTRVKQEWPSSSLRAADAKPRNTRKPQGMIGPCSRPGALTSCSAVAEGSGECNGTHASDAEPAAPCEVRRQKPLLSNLLSLPLMEMSSVGQISRRPPVLGSNGQARNRREGGANQFLRRTPVLLPKGKQREGSRISTTAKLRRPSRKKADKLAMAVEGLHGGETFVEDNWPACVVNMMGPEIFNRIKEEPYAE